MQANKDLSPRDLVLIESKTFSSIQPIRVLQQVEIALPWPMGKQMIRHCPPHKLTNDHCRHALKKYCFYLPLRVLFGLVGNSHTGAAAACLRASLLISATWKTLFNMMTV